MPKAGAGAREATLTLMANRHEPFKEIINRFGLLVSRQAELRAELPDFEAKGLVFEEERFLSGEPLLSGVDPALFAPGFKASALRLWPVMGVIFPALAEALAGLRDRIERDPDWVNSCLHAVIRGDAKTQDQLAAAAGVSPDFLFTAFLTALAPCIAASRSALLAPAQAELWRKAHCPVCGSNPDLATLENHPDPSEFLVSKSGEVWHHCPVCTHRWRFVRMECPGCGNQDHKTLTRFTVSDCPNELIYACEQCRQYLPCLDMVEKSENVDFDLAALGLVHLDAAAQSRGYTPLSPAPWSAFGFAQEKAKVS